MALKLAQDTIINCEDKVVQLEKVELLPEKISVDEYFTLLNREPKNASVKVADNKLVYEAESPGISIDRTTLEAIVSEIENSQDNQVTLPVAFSSPQLGLDALKAMVFRDTLSTKSTQFYTGNTNDMNRGQNIRISVEKINGKILGPGETFSFNQVVGPRTVSNGYKIAHVYANGKVVDDVGGGICQVSTTLYNAALFSDLETVSRTNHMFTVGYIPLGQDAAVAYDYTDLKFKNNTNYPIKIEGWVTPGNQVYFSIKGTNEAPGKIVEITNKTTRVNEFQTKYIDDPNMDEGKSYVKTGGMTGYVVDTYKTIKQNGQVISQNKIYTSVYNPLTSEVVKGTKKPDPLPEASPNNGDNKAQAQN